MLKKIILRLCYKGTILVSLESCVFPIYYIRCVGRDEQKKYESFLNNHHAVLTFLFGAQKDPLIEMVLSSTHMRNKKIDFELST